MKVLTCASFYGSGSSAFTDLVAEYSNVKDMSDFEFRFLHCLDGVSDLEYHLVKNQNRSNSGYALKRFERMSLFNNGNRISKRYSNFFDNNDYLRITKQYIEDLLDFKYPGFNFNDLYDRGPRVYYLFQALSKISRKLKMPFLNPLNKEMTYCSLKNEDQFLEATQKYVHSLLLALNQEEKEYIEIDQIVPSSNIDLYLRYFSDDIFVFIVDRDPRDVFLLGKYYWQESICPKKVNDFCEWFEYNRKPPYSLTKDERIIHVRFEDLVYKYEETVEMIEDVTGLSKDSHIRQFSKFNPKRSAHNTQLWKRHATDEDLRDMEIIEKKLSKYLYDYSKVGNETIVGLATDKTNSF